MGGGSARSYCSRAGRAAARNDGAESGAGLNGPSLCGALQRHEGRRMTWLSASAGLVYGVGIGVICLVVVMLWLTDHNTGCPYCGGRGRPRHTKGCWRYEEDG